MDLDRRQVIRLAYVALGTALIAVAVAFIAPYAGWGPSLLPPGAGAATATATGIDPNLLLIYATVAERSECDVRWSDLAAIGQTESGHGRVTTWDADGYAGAAMMNWDVADYSFGPMQIQGYNIDTYGTDGNGDGRIELGGNGGRQNYWDAVATADAMLCAYNYQDDRQRAIHAYNGLGAPASRYAIPVMELSDDLATQAGGLPATVPDTPGMLANTAAFWSWASQEADRNQWPAISMVAEWPARFFAWASGGTPPPSTLSGTSVPRGRPDPGGCQGMHVRGDDGRFLAPPGRATPEMMVAIARALRARYGVDSSQFRALQNRSWTGRAACSDHLWGGGLDIGGHAGDGVTDRLVTFLRPAEGRVFRIIMWRVPGHHDHVHLSLDPDASPEEVADLVAQLCAGYDCAAQSTWWPRAQDGVEDAPRD